MKLTKEDLLQCFEGVKQSEREIVEPLIEEAIFIKEKLEETKEMPFVNENGKSTGAYQVYKTLVAAYSNITKILVNSVRKVEEDEANELLKKLESF